MSPQLDLAVHLLSGKRVPAFLCEREPTKTPGDLARVTLGTGTFNADGGRFKVRRRGWIECIAVPWKGGLVITRPNYLPLFGREGQEAKCGPLSLQSNGALQQ